MAFFKHRRKTPSLGAKALPIGAGIAALGGLVVAYLRWFRPGVAAELTGARAEDNPAGSKGSAGTARTSESGAEALAGRFQGLDDQHAATHYPPSLERDPKQIEQSIHEG